MPLPEHSPTARDYSFGTPQELAPETGLASIDAPFYWVFEATLLSIRLLLKRTLDLLSGTPPLMASDTSSDT